MIELSLGPVYSFLIDTCARNVFATLELYFDKFILILLYHIVIRYNISIVESYYTVEGLEEI